MHHGFLDKSENQNEKSVITVAAEKIWMGMWAWTGILYQFKFLIEELKLKEGYMICIQESILVWGNISTVLFAMREYYALKI